MRTLVGLFAALLLLSASARAQVINGEGTYEGSTLHSPPPDTETAQVRGTGETKPNAVKAPRQQRRD